MITITDTDANLTVQYGQQGEAVRLVIQTGNAQITLNASQARALGILLPVALSHAPVS